jgi:hypothetical protein
MCLHYNHMLSSSSLSKNKEVLAKNGGGKFRKKCVSISLLVEVKSLLKMKPTFITIFRLGNPFVSHFTIQNFICWVLLESMLPINFTCHSYVGENSNLNKPSIESTICSYKFSTMSAFPESVPNNCML